MRKLLFIVVLVIVSGAILATAFPERATEIVIGAERSASGLDAKTLAVGTGTWHYLEGGPAGADTILLLHGFGGDKDNWVRFSKQLTGDYRVLIPDLPGFGESERDPDKDYTLRAQRERLRRFVDALGLDDFHVAGHSMGGHLAALYTHEYQDEIRSMALFNNAGITAPERSDMMVALEQGENPLIVESVEDFDELLEFASWDAPFIPWPVKDVLARRAVEQAGFNARVFEALIGELFVSLEPLLGDIRTPVMILWGDNDRLLDVSTVEVMQRLVPQAKVVIMQQTGHLPILERPAETAQHYMAFLEST